jgi:hypothetical protein
MPSDTDELPPWIAVATDRVLAAVGPEYVPPNLNRRIFGLRLASAKVNYCIACEMHQGTAKRYRKTERIIATAKRLKLQLQSDKIYSRRFYTLIRRLDESIVCFEHRTLSITKRSQRWIERQSMLHVRERSAIEWLTGVELPRIFEEHFHIEAKVEWGPNRGALRRSPGGPYICFAREFLIEFVKRKFSDKTIALALTDARSGRARRKG